MSTYLHNGNIKGKVGGMGYFKLLNSNLSNMYYARIEIYSNDVLRTPLQLCQTNKIEQ
jgi:hypothetical protein